MTKFRLIVILALALTMLISINVAHAQTAATVAVSQNSEFGSILVDANGITLYLFTDDEREKSNCSGGCATTWPPLTTDGDPVAEGEVNADRLGTIDRDDGSTQVTYNGWPLYYFANDTNPGDTNGQYGTWFVVSIHGGPIQNNAAVNTTEDSVFGTILAEASGRIIYLFTDDEREKSNCAGGCARAWPPLLTVGDPVAGEGVNADRLGTIAREDGYTQVTYNGWPLYYFARDEKPGDTSGQYGTWFVVSIHGGPIQNNAAVNTTEDSVFGTILAEVSGRIIYLFTDDEREKSNCAGGCARAWPPLLTVGDPVAGEGVNADRLGTIAREDGYTQVTYNGWPLYYFARDEKPGDTSGQYGTWFVVTVHGGPIQNNAAVNTTEDSVFGTILAEVSGRIIYLFTDDEREKSNCAGGCARAWPPLLTVGDPAAGEGVNAELLGTIAREDGYTQVTYNGWPLYYFARDEKPGDTSGQYGTWFVVTIHGGLIQNNAAVSVVEHADLGEILVDHSGRSLYLFTNDVADTSNCSGGCAERWPPLLTVGDPAAGDGASADLLGTTARDDGSVQVTYNGAPLYYFVGDDKPGDANGQDVGNVWFVLQSTRCRSARYRA